MGEQEVGLQRVRRRPQDDPLQIAEAAQTELSREIQWQDTARVADRDAVPLYQTRSRDGRGVDRGPQNSEAARVVGLRREVHSDRLAYNGPRL